MFNPETSRLEVKYLLAHEPRMWDSIFFYIYLTVNKLNAYMYKLVHSNKILGLFQQERQRSKLLLTQLLIWDHLKPQIY